MSNPIKHLTLDPQVQQSIIEDRHLAFTWTDLIPNSRYPLFEETMLYLFDLLYKVKPDRILETGSGLTSALLRKYCPDATIFSVDHDQAWLDKTGEIVRRFAVDRRHFYLWKDFLLLSVVKPFDFIIHDLGNMEIRMDTIDTVMGYANSSFCWVLLDNFGIPKYKEYAMKQLTSLGFVPLFPLNPMKLNVSNAGGFAAFARE